MEKDELLKEIARAFGWYKKKNQYDYDSTQEPITPTEAQVLVHIGRLLEKQTILTYITDVENLKLEVQELRIAVKESHRTT